VGHLMHIVYKTADGKNILRSNFWLGDINKEYEGINCIAACTINLVGNTWLFRRIRANGSLAVGLYRHCYEEMTCLRKFLPRFYAVEAAKDRVVRSMSVEERALFHGSENATTAVEALETSIRSNEDDGGEATSRYVTQNAEL
jgi:hypothetical protein